MKNRGIFQVVAVFLAVLLASPMFSPLSAASGAVALGRVVATAPASVNGIGIPGDATLFSGDRLATGPDGSARVLLPQGEQIQLAAQTAAEASSQGELLAVELLSGRLAIHTRARSNVNVRSNGLEIVPRADSNAVWEVARLGEHTVLVAAHKGTVEVRGTNRTMEVAAGQSLQVESTAPAPPKGGPVGAGSSAGLSAGATAGIVAGIIGVIVAVAVVANNRTQNKAVVSPSGT